MAKPITSWGRAHRFEMNQIIIPDVRDVSEVIFSRTEGIDRRSIAFFGLGRSYGDVNLNEGGDLFLNHRKDKILSADWNTGIIRAEGGLSIAELIKLTIPRGWMIPVSPGTKYVTLAGAVANDVHGKNHHIASSFGAHITALGLVRSDIGEVTCTPTQNTSLFKSTISGLGLTGYISWVEIQLKPIKSSQLFVENIKCNNIDTFLSLSEESKDWEFTVMWLDCFASGSKLGRGIFSRARFLEDENLTVRNDNRTVSVPLELPSFCLNKFTVSAFNWLYRHRPGASYRGHVSYDKFFYPLDDVLHWNRIYGRKGFYQHQCIIPKASAKEGITKLLEEIAQSDQGSFLSVLKYHGKERSKGIISFCFEGVSLALDFPNRGQKTRSLLSRLDEIVVEYSGRVYPAKDGRMSAETFQTCYPNWQALEAARDPQVSTSFWRRVTQRDK